MSTGHLTSPGGGAVHGTTVSGNIWINFIQPTDGDPNTTENITFVEGYIQENAHSAPQVPLTLINTSPPPACSSCNYTNNMVLYTTTMMIMKLDHHASYTIYVKGHVTGFRMIPPGSLTPYDVSQTITITGNDVAVNTAPDYVIAWNPATMTGVNLPFTWTDAQTNHATATYTIGSVTRTVGNLASPGGNPYLWDGKDSSDQIVMSKGLYPTKVSVTTNAPTMTSSNNRSEHLTITNTSVTYVNSTNDNNNFQVSYKLTDDKNRNAASGELWVYDPDLGRIATIPLTGLTAGSAGTTNQQTVAIPVDEMSIAGTYRFAYHILDSDANEYREHANRYVFEPISNFTWNYWIDIDDDANGNGTMDDGSGGDGGGRGIGGGGGGGGVVGGGDDPVENTTGMILAYNDDDDDHDHTIDRNDTTAVSNENDLVGVNLSWSSSFSGYKVTLSAPVGSSNIKVYTSPNMGNTQITLPRTYIIGTDQIPAAVYVEGYNTGTATLALSMATSTSTVLCRDNLKFTIVDVDLSAHGHDFDHPSSVTGIVVPEVNAQGDENDPGAYIHANLDDDNWNGHPDCNDHTGGVDGENDMKQLTLAFAPTNLNFGSVSITRADGDIQVWRDANKSQPLLASGSGGAYDPNVSGNGYKTWDLSNTTQLADFNNIRESLWVENTGTGNGGLAIWYFPPVGMGGQTCPDQVFYKKIIAACGHQPSLIEYQNMYPDYFGGDTGLVDCEFSILDNTITKVYNCIAWSINEFNTWYNPQDIDDPNNGGNDNGIFQNSDMTTFYNNKRGWSLIDQDPDTAHAMYYPIPTNWNFRAFPESELPSPGYHAAKRRNCTCGETKWIMYESKCGDGYIIEHVWNQLNLKYGTATKMFYR